MLEARAVTKRFGRLLANDQVDFSVAPGEVVALVGENGAGKSTLVKILAGILRPDDGVVAVDGRPVALRSAREAAAAGIGAVHQHFALVPSLTVLENLWLAMGGSRAALAEKARRIMEETGVEVALDRPVARLPLPLQQRAEILRALLQDCRYLLLDEPTAALGPADAEAVRQLVRKLGAGGRGVVMVTHKLADVLTCTDRVMVLRRGRRVGEWPVQGAEAGAICEAMVGELCPALPAPNPGRRGDAVTLALHRVSYAAPSGGAGLRELSLELHAGEILGIAGVSGNGQEALAGVAAGLWRPDSGQVLLDRSDVSSLSPADRLRLGLGHVPADRRRYGAAGALPVYRNLCLRRYRERRLSPGGWASPRRWQSFAQALMAEVSARWPLDLPAAHLSGGNLQRLILTRELDAGRRALVAVYPTRGLDGAATAHVRSLLRERRSSGGSVLLISEDLDELLELSDRIAVLSAGEILSTLDRTEATAERMGKLFSGARGESSCEAPPPR